MEDTNKMGDEVTVASTTEGSDEEITVDTEADSSSATETTAEIGDEADADEVPENLEVNAESSSDIEDKMV